MACEEAVAAAVPEVTIEAVETQIEPVKEAQENPPVTATKAKKAKEPKEKKKSVAAKKRSRTHPPYFEMVQEAISSLKERTGSSQYAIQKFIEDNQKALPPNFRRLLLVQLRKFVASDKLVKVKNSYKLPSARSASSKTAAAPPAPAKKPSAPVKAKVTVKKAAAKPKPKSVAKPKAVTAAKPKTKTAAKAKAPSKVAPSTAKAKAVAKPKESLKRKAVPKSKPVAKVARTSARTTPGKKVAVAKVVPKKAAPAKSVKAKTAKSPAKKATAKKGRN